jgi:hypothetical protein
VSGTASSRRGALSRSLNSIVFLGPVSEFLGRAKVLHYGFAGFFRESY